MALKREHLLQLARLIGARAFAERFGPPQSAEPDIEALRSLLDERLDDVTASLVAEAAASDDVIDVAGAEAYLDDRLRTLSDIVTAGQSERIRVGFREKTKGW